MTGRYGYESRRMQCAYCGIRKAWPDGFVDTSLAECWSCAWKHHVASDHAPRRWWRRSR